QLYVFGRINSSWDMASYDFLGGNVAAITADTNLSDGMTFDPIAGATYTIAANAGISGVGQIALTATGGNGGFFGSAGGTPTERTLNPVFESRVALSQNTNVRAVVGFSDRALNTGIAADTNNFTSEAMFRKTAAGVVWNAVTRAGGAETVTVLTANPTTMAILRIEVDNGAGAVRFYINGALVATHTTNIPAAATRLGYHVGATLSAATATNVYVDYLRVWSDDPPISNFVNLGNGETPLMQAQESILANTYSSKGFLQEMDNILDSITNTKTLSGILSFQEKGEYSQDEYAGYTLNFTKKSLEKMSGTHIDTNLSIDALETDNIVTDQLCVGGVCINSGSVLTLDLYNSVLENMRNGFNSFEVELDAYTQKLNYEKLQRENDILALSQKMESEDDKIRASITTLSGRLDVAERKIIDITPTVSGESTLVYTGTSLSEEDTVVLNMIVGTVEQLFINTQAKFNRIVAFMDAVTFESEVTFKKRVIFDDRDMSGTAKMLVNSGSVQVVFEQPYQSLPNVVVTPSEFVMYRVTSRSSTGFTIETSAPVSVDTYFSWMALSTSNIPTETSAPLSSAPVTNEVSTPVEQVVSESTESTDSGTIPEGATPVENSTGTTLVPTLEIITPIDTSSSQTGESGTGTESTETIPEGVTETGTTPDIPVTPIETELVTQPIESGTGDVQI
ncbi:hypothetical protein KBD33_05650, partial [Candidatus Gracilibacteria bacterium]|nr:hypothetical protein [Candidatus Gracilibacteria bacterium]